MDKRTKWILSRRKELRFNYARDPDTPLAALYGLADTDEPSVRVSLASNPSLPVDILEQLADDPYWLVRMTVTTNPGAPVEAIKNLVRDQDNMVSWSATKRVAEEERYQRRKEVAERQKQERSDQ